jgi:hypothetical protein
MSSFCLAIPRVPARQCFCIARHDVRHQGFSLRGAFDTENGLGEIQRAFGHGRAQMHDGVDAYFGVPRSAAVPVTTTFLPMTIGPRSPDYGRLKAPW